MTQLLEPLEPTALASLLGLPVPPAPREEAVLAELAQVTLESCLLRFISEYSEAEQSELETWLTAHRDDPTLTEELLQKFPKFATILGDELEALVQVSGKVREAIVSH